jgi:hypothetical protein
MAMCLAMAALLPLSPAGLAGENESPNAVTSNGITVEFAARAATQEDKSDKIVAGQNIEVRFKVTDAVRKTAVSKCPSGSVGRCPQEDPRARADIR